MREEEVDHPQFFFNNSGYRLGKSDTKTLPV